MYCNISYLTNQFFAVLMLVLRKEDNLKYFEVRLKMNLKTIFLRLK